jgi:hypothetical protein
VYSETVAVTVTGDAGTVVTEVTFEGGGGGAGVEVETTVVDLTIVQGQLVTVMVSEAVAV